MARCDPTSLPVKYHVPNSQDWGSLADVPRNDRVLRSFGELGLGLELRVRVRAEGVCTCVVEAFCTSSASTKVSSIVRPGGKGTSSNLGVREFVSSIA